jgi:dolichol kinase
MAAVGSSVSAFGDSTRDTAGDSGILRAVDALADRSGQLVVELHRVLSDIDPARWNAGAAEAVRARLAELRARVAELAEAHWPEREARLPASLSELYQRLAEMPDADATMASAQVRWMAFKASVVPSYEALSSALRAYEIHVPSLRPTNYRRNLTHVLSGVGCIAILWAVPTPAWAMAIAVPACLMAWTAELSRRRSPRVNAMLMRALGPIAHPHEHRRVNSATWYTTALAVLSIMETRVPAAIGLAVLAFGDPAAALVGRRFGRVSIRHGRTLEGTLAFLLAGGLAALFAVQVFAPGLAPGVMLSLAAAGAIAGALAELFSLRIDDNLSIPLVAAGAVMLASTFV